MRQTGAGEVTKRERHVRHTDEFVALAVEIVKRRRPIGKYRAERARVHLFEAERHDAVGGARFYGLACEKQRA